MIKHEESILSEIHQQLVLCAIPEILFNSKLVYHNPKWRWWCYFCNLRLIQFKYYKTGFVRLGYFALPWMKAIAETVILFYVSSECSEFLASHLWLPQVIENHFHLYIQVTTLVKVRNAGREFCQCRGSEDGGRLCHLSGGSPKKAQSGTCSRVKNID